MKFDPFEAASRMMHTVYVEKFSFLTYVPDVKHLPTKFQREIGVERRRSLGRLWRARIGKKQTWSYGWSAPEALTVALKVYAPGEFGSKRRRGSK